MKKIMVCFAVLVGLIIGTNTYALTKDIVFEQKDYQIGDMVEFNVISDNTPIIHSISGLEIIQTEGNIIQAIVIDSSFELAIEADDNMLMLVQYPEEIVIEYGIDYEDVELIY